MTDYRITVKDANRKSLEGFEAWITHGAASHPWPPLQVKKAGTTSVPTDFNQSNDQGRLYIRGPARIGDPPNFAHNEVVRLNTKGKFNFVLHDCTQPPTTVPGKDPNRIDLTCVDLTFTVDADPGNSGRSFTFLATFAGGSGLHPIVPETRVWPGTSQTISLPSGSVTLHVIFWELDASGTKGPEQRREVKLRQGNVPMSAEVRVAVAQRSAAGTGPRRELIDAPENFFHNRKSRSLEFRSPTESNQPAGQVLIDMGEALASYVPQYCAAMTGGKNGGSLIALYSEDYGFFRLAGHVNYSWAAFRWYEGGGPTELVHDEPVTIRVDKLLIEWDA